jgi:ABC-2 type transport system ATP-binding protein
MSGYAIETFDLTKKFEKKVKVNGNKVKKLEILANDHINLKVREGEVFGIIGPNGAGKTTFLRLISGLLIPDEGYALVDGYDIRKIGHSINRMSVTVAVLGSLSEYWVRQTAREFLEFEGRFWCIPKDVLRERIPELLKFLELDEWAEEIPVKFSSGMQRKLMLARALMRDTPIILFDEPTIMLDPPSARSIRDHIKRRAKEQGKTVILTTLYMHEAEYCCDKIAFINHGRVVALGSPDDLKDVIVEEDIVEIVVKNVPAKLVSRIKDMPDILNVRIKENIPSNFHTLVVSDKKDTLQIPNIVREIAINGGQIYNVSRTRPTLEDVFARLGGSREK